ncbi:hypothetical protein SAMN03159341_116111 [Paenibacillus sp. 1_12]|nr:hypothetical protein [Paenibacillus sp. 1_12]SFM10540.1 hypothetical protein SAMN03159341_116111 [Paenibacillus sp. 1_12]
MDHKIRVDDWHVDAMIVPMSALVDLVQVLITKYFQEKGFALEEEHFYF